MTTNQESACFGRDEGVHESEYLRNQLDLAIVEIRNLEASREEASLESRAWMRLAVKSSSQSVRSVILVRRTAGEGEAVLEAFLKFEPAPGEPLLEWVE